MEVNNFDVLKRMAAENKDIRMGTDLLNMRAVKAGSQITMGIAGNVLAELMFGELKACLILYSKNQFEELKSEMSLESSSTESQTPTSNS
jgi:hypothetical protein